MEDCIMKVLLIKSNSIVPGSAFKDSYVTESGNYSKNINDAKIYKNLRDATAEINPAYADTIVQAEMTLKEIANG
jgi:hypothetical protein